jgi:tetrahydromethanopterin S-methyltransferase subunit G
MSDEKQNFENVSKSISKVDGTVFTNFSKPYLDFLGKGKLFSIIYIIMAIINLILPFVIIYKVVDSGLFRGGQAKFIITFIFSWIIIAFACWVGFQLWWDRKSKIKALEESEFIVTPIFSELFQTFGEWIGTLIGIIGAGVGLVATIVLGDYASYLFSAIGLGFLPSGIIVVIAGPLIGFVIIILSRFIAEQMRLLVALVNNARNIAINIKESKSTNI